MDKKQFPFPSKSENAKIIQDAQNHGSELTCRSVWVWTATLTQAHTAVVQWRMFYF
jgi:hypothetical protein